MVVLEVQLVLALFWHLHPHSCLSDLAALRPVGLQQVFSAVAMKTSLTEGLALPVLALILQRTVYPGVVESAGILSQQQVDAGLVGRLFAEVVDNYPFSQPKTLMARLFCFSTLGICEMGVGTSMPSKLSPSCVEYLWASEGLWRLETGQTGGTI